MINRNSLFDNLYYYFFIYVREHVEVDKNYIQLYKYDLSEF